MRAKRPVVKSGIETIDPVLRRFDKVDFCLVAGRAASVRACGALGMPLARVLLEGKSNRSVESRIVPLYVLFRVDAFLCIGIDVLPVGMWICVRSGRILRGLVLQLANRHRSARWALLVDVHALWVVSCAVRCLLLCAFAHVLIECLLTVRGTVGFRGGFFGLLLLCLFVGLSLGHDVCEELEVLHSSDCVCYMAVSERQQMSGTDETYQRHGTGYSSLACALT